MFLNGRCTRSPQQRVNAGHEHARLDGLDHEIVCTELEPQHLVDVAVACGQDENRQGMSRPQLPAHVETALARQPEVEYQEIGPFALHAAEHAIAAIFDRHIEPVAIEIAADELGQALIVFNEQYPGALAEPICLRVWRSHLRKEYPTAGGACVAAAALP